MCRLLLTAAAYNQALIVIKGMEHIPDVTSHMTRPMDIWSGLGLGLGSGLGLGLGSRVRV